MGIELRQVKHEYLLNWTSFSMESLDIRKVLDWASEYGGGWVFVLFFGLQIGTS